MLPLGLLLLVAAGVVGAAVALHNTDPVSLAAFGESYATSSRGVFLAGAITGAVAMLGLAMMLAGARRRRGRRHQLKTRVRDVHSENEQLAEENARLRSQVPDETTVAGDPYPTEASSRTGKHTLRP